MHATEVTIHEEGGRRPQGVYTSPERTSVDVTVSFPYGSGPAALADFEATAARVRACILATIPD